MRSPWPNNGHVNRNCGHLGERGYSRSGLPFTGQKNINSYTNRAPWRAACNSYTPTVCMAFQVVKQIMLLTMLTVPA